MKVDLIQTSFVGGEFAPSLFGRTDIAQYANACATLENFLVRPYGPIITTPGTEYISECKTGGSTSISRLLQFVFSRTDSYIIEMGVGYFRFYTNGAVVVSPGTTPYEVAHTYTATQIPDIQYCQLNDIIYIVHPSHPPRKLVRYSSTSWSLSTVAIVGGPFQDDNTDTTITITASATSGTVNLTVSPTNSNLFTVSGSTLGHKETYWKIGVATTDSTTGLDVKGYVKITNVVNSYTATASVIKILSTSAATSSWAKPAWSDVSGWPGSVTFHQQRLFFARTTTEPQKVWGSKTFVYEDFAINASYDDDALNLQLASNESNDIKWLSSGRSLIAGTYGGSFAIRSGDDSPLTPSNANASPEVNVGSDAIVPRRIGNFFYYVQRFGEKLREMFYLWDNDSYKAVDKTILSPHISGGGFIDLAYQQNPDTILWCVCSNGTIATMTREIDQEVQAWSKQNTDGKYESIATIPSRTSAHDEVWVIVNRTINGATRRYIERFKSQEVPDRQDQCFYVHSGLTYDAYTANTTVTIGISATSGTVTVSASGAYFNSGDVGQRIRAINSSGSTIGELKITAYTSSTVVAGTVKYDFDATTYAPGYWGLSVNTISGLAHLNLKEVSALVDGGTSKPNQTVTGGSITLPYDGFVVNVGLSYTQKFKSLPKEAGSQRGTSQGKKQRINEVGFKVNRSYKGFYCGGASDMLDKVQFRDPTTLMGTPELLYTGTIPNISFRDDYRYGSQVMIQCSDPLPIELLSLMMTLDTNDK